MAQPAELPPEQPTNIENLTQARALEPEEQATTFLERARNLDLNRADAIAIATLAGFGIATVAAVLTKRKLGDRVKGMSGEDVVVASEPTQYMKGFASFVKLLDGSGGGFPTDEKAAERLTGAQAATEVAAFLVEKGGKVTHVAQEGAQNHSRYKEAGKYAIELAKHALPDLLARKSDTATKQPRRKSRRNSAK